MGIPSEYLLQYAIFAGLFLSGTVAYFLVSSKLKDPDKIYQSHEQ
jgi:hypothetical protein